MREGCMLAQTFYPEWQYMWDLCCILEVNFTVHFPSTLQTPSSACSAFYNLHCLWMLDGMNLCWSWIGPDICCWHSSNVLEIEVNELQLIAAFIPDHAGGPTWRALHRQNRSFLTNALLWLLWIRSHLVCFIYSLGPIVLNQQNEIIEQHGQQTSVWSLLWFCHLFNGEVCRCYSTSTKNE